jgi:hypothetical protein
MGAMMQMVLAWVGQLGLTAALAAAAAYGLFNWLGQKWIEGRYAEQLVKLKAAADEKLEVFRSEKAEQRDALNRDYQREADRLKAEVARLTDRASQLHKREYEVLPEAWGLLNKAYGRVIEAHRSGAIYPHFDTKDRAALEHFIDGEDLADYQKAQLKVSETWYRDYTKMRQNRAVFEARVMVGDFNNFIVLNGVFFEEALLLKMGEIKELIAQANEKRWAILEEINEPTDEATAKSDLARAAGLIGEVKGLVRAKLFETTLSGP